MSRLIGMMLFIFVKIFCNQEMIAPGIFYQHVIMHKPNQSVHLLIVDPKYAYVTIGFAEHQYGRAEKTSEIATKHRAIAAVNGGFFDFGVPYRLQTWCLKILDAMGMSFYSAYPSYTLQVDYDLYAIANTITGALWWDNQKMAQFGVLKSSIVMHIDDNKYLIQNYNKPDTRKAALYSDRYVCTPRYSTRMHELVIGQDHCVIALKKNSPGRTNIPKNGYIYVSPILPHDWNEIIGKQVVINLFNNVNMNSVKKKIDAPYILGSTPLLIYQGNVIADLYYKRSSFYTKEYPRTAVGILKDGRWVFLVVDGRQKKSQGLTIVELAQYMKSLGCYYALNLDGGSSSTMVINNKVVNAPSGRTYSLFKKEVRVSHALLIYSYS